MKINRIFATGLLALLSALPSQAATIVSNLTQPNSAQGTAVFFQSPSGDDLAESFTTGTSAATLNSITLRIRRNTTDGGGGFSLQLWSNASTLPGISLITLSGTADPLPATVGTVSDFTYTGSTALNASTTYWVVATVTQSSPNKTYTWNQTNNSIAETGTAGWTIGDTLVDRFRPGTTWTNDLGPPLQLSIDATIVPEPATWAMLCGGIGMLAAFKRSARSRNS